MSNRGNKQTPATGVPTGYPTTTPPLDQSFTLPTIMTMQSQLGGITEQLRTIEKQLDTISSEHQKHGKWIYAVNAFMAFLILLFTVFGSRVWDVLEKQTPQAGSALTAPAPTPPVSPVPAKH